MGRGRLLRCGMARMRWTDTVSKCGVLGMGISPLVGGLLDSGHSTYPNDPVPKMARKLKASTLTNAAVSSSSALNAPNPHGKQPKYLCSYSMG
ncbi:hypothetical protein M8818_004060 [Zalaria obscura]|uniref:Uncharacterized protein n=1 Tax=Zalaria obscura TaxID=2024903 RepID=A0ACC3SCT2_9PEZI